MTYQDAKISGMIGVSIGTLIGLSMFTGNPFKIALIVAIPIASMPIVCWISGRFFS